MRAGATQGTGGRIPLSEGVDRGRPARRGRSGVESAAQALLQSQDGERHLIVGERVPARALIASIRAAVTGSPGEAKGSLSMTDAAQRFADDVDALPEAGGREQDGIRGGSKPLDELRSRRRALHAESGCGSASSTRGWTPRSTP